MESILITGATGLLGKSFVEHFLDKNMTVIAVYRNEEKFNSVFKKDENLYGICVDLLDENAADSILAELDRLNIFPEYLVNAVGSPESLKVGENGLSERKNLLAQYVLNVAFPYELSFKLANHKETKLKKIVNISSMYGVVPYNPSLYNNPLTETPIQYPISKAAMIHLTKELAIRFADKNIAVNSISYGGVESRANEEFKSKFAKVTPMKRMMKIEETIGALDFLIGGNSSYMTGHNLIVDGGRTIW